MAQYFQIEFQNISTAVSELLVAQLSEIGFEGFEEEGNILKAFIPADSFDKRRLNEVTGQFGTIYTQSIIEETNWNQLWESNFQPVIMDHLIHKAPWVAIRADFHEPFNEIEYEIIITPKMSFGTGHHATTSMMIQQMSQIDFNNKFVLDFGTGTGVLSILAEKMGASKVIAIDNDKWSIENAKENLQKNNCEKIELIKTDNLITGHKFDIILANINKNVILENFSELAKQLTSSGMLLVSGLLAEDEEDLLNKAKISELYNYQIISANNWLCIRFCH